ncbi:Purine catabolism regulatory protein [Pandoraea pnomenusa]|uniref:Purine catabolism regulatory protein n=1 Tax=Pandoraea pnomenusa TaxID=93220 RepID=A0ABY6WMU8_9BURK|nr:helix-turn-helix domain-containing protein [Pandoraea pnomenusa]VVE70220.1 Purine catabolism regulatory protein [Pandoraea pnomenusa]
MPEHHQRLMALRHVASQISNDEDIDALFRDLVRGAVQHGGWDLGSVMSIDLAHGYGLVITRFETSMLPQHVEDRWELATSPSLIALQTNEPVYIRDALENPQFPGYRREARERGYRTVLVLPMASRDTEGRPMVLTVASRKVRDVGEDDLTFMATVVHLGAIAVERAHRQRAQVMAHERLQRTLEAQRTLLGDVLAGGSFDQLTSSLSDLIGRPVLVIDFLANQWHASASPVPSLMDDAAWTRWLSGAQGRELSANVRDALQRYRQTRLDVPLGRPPGQATVGAGIEPLTVDDDLVGALLTFGDDALSDLQQLLLESARFALSVQLMRSVVRFRFETRTLTELFFEIVERRWRDEGDLISRARHLGVALDAPLRMMVVDYPDQRTSVASGRAAGHLSLESHSTVELLARQLNVPMHIVTIGGGLVCLAPQDGSADATALARLARRMSEALARSLGREPIIVMSDLCEGLEPLAREWERCWRMIRVARKFGRSGPLDMPGLGPLPMLMGAADSSDVHGFVEGTIGKLVEHDRQSGSPYLDTLTEYVRSGCRSQPCADAMGLHVTTLRYRLARIQELFGIDVETPERRFAVELAIHLHALTKRAAPVTPGAAPSTEGAKSKAMQAASSVHAGGRVASASMKTLPRNRE